MAKRTTRIYWRLRSYGMAAYADFRDFAEVGGGQEALIAQGEDRPTTDDDTAAKLLAERLTQLMDARKALAENKPVATPPNVPLELGAYATRHLRLKAGLGKYNKGWLRQAQRHLEAACDLIGPKTRLVEIEVTTVSDTFLTGLDAWVRRKNRRKGRRAKTLSPGSKRKYLNSLSNMLRRAVAEGIVKYNAVALLMEKPEADTEEAEWFEVHEAALILEAARLYRPNSLKPEQSLPYLYPVVATLLLTGGRLAEVLGLEVRDVNFEKETVRFRKNQWRDLKTKGSARPVRLWPQLAAILEEYLNGPHAPKGRLLFPAYNVEQEQMITDIRRPLDRAMAAIGYAAGEVRAKAFRHTFCSARLQTLDGGQPVSPFTVAVEMGHGGIAMVKNVYGHLGTIRHRSEFVEYRIEQCPNGYAAKVEQLKQYWADEPARVAAWKAEVGRRAKEGKARRRLEKAS